MSSPVFTAFYALIQYENAKAREARAHAATKRARARLTAAQKDKARYIAESQNPKTAAERYTAEIITAKTQPARSK